MIAVAITMLVTVLPSAATIPIASTNSGNAMMVSETRPTMRSVQPPKKPAAIPASPPITSTSATEAMAIVKSRRVAASTRLKISRPNRSVPNQWCSDGDCSVAEVSLASGS